MKGGFGLIKVKKLFGGSSASAPLVGARRNIKFYGPSQGAGGAVSGEKRVFFVPLRTAVLYPFSYPFGRRGSLRNAISFSFRPILGGLAERLSMIPQITEQRADLTRGAAWFVSKEEVEECEEKFGREIVLLPAPAAFASEAEGGVVVWRGVSGCCAIWFEEDLTPRFYKYMSPSEGGAGELADLMRGYASSCGAEIAPGNVRIIDGESLSREELRRAAEASFAASPSLSRLDLSSRGTSTAERCDAFFASCFAALKAASAVGLIFLILSSILLIQNKRAASSFESAPREIYTAALGGTSRSPLASATKQLGLLSGGGVQLTLDGTLANFAAAWKELPDAKAVRIDAIRYGLERTEVEGQASKAEDIQKLRDALGRNGFAAKTGDVQRIPGGGMRFTLTLSEGGRSE
ncbi:type II secretion system protein GspL [Synergistes jonesii]|uniref:GspL periplasmic domain-containing protein n=1 Tax=Synergistes jonesii TaxID=2754 RepID=A0A073ITJ1_9BACT|nr:type II secretion system protein GspL [Synergistes jonesii]KEJ92801.1 hypothetical protein EH55_01070 [Synergistes jonesii]OFB62437.1 hypothetical protein JS72_08605 [Synergistes jonesii]OFB63732.1 hypothetical protein JS73_04395 [Synergistes jonesii]OFB65051.1 hypothetical protein JS79_04950 [Synergistes jonesii]OFB68241.1 hypothetical protein JS78_04415 [Synergistes jonesii]